MGAVFLHGMGTSSGARQCGVTHVPGLKCYLCPRTVPPRSGADALCARSLRALCDSGTPVARLKHEFGADSQPGEHVN